MSKAIKEWILAVLVAVLVTFLLRSYIFTNSSVSGVSMAPNFATDERVVVDKIVYVFRNPKQGEVVIFHSPEGQNWIKRVIALPGDTIEINEQDVFVNGKKLSEHYIKPEPDASNMYKGYKLEKMTIPEDSVFVMGDNRLNSKDSRVVGPIKIDSIIGRADMIYYPTADIKIIAHAKYE